MAIYECCTVLDGRGAELRAICAMHTHRIPAGAPDNTV
jgi:hypothetical protein